MSDGAAPNASNSAPSSAPTLAQQEAALDELLDVLRVEPRSSDDEPAAAPAERPAEGGVTGFVGRGSGHDEFGLYGGHMLGQAVAAACETTAHDKPLHSIHAYFLRAGDGMGSVDYDVEVVREGRSFCTRRVQARQPSGGVQPAKLIFDLTASFHVAEEADAKIEAPMPAGLTPPEQLPTFADCIDEVGPIFGEHWSHSPRPVDYRVAHAPWAPTGPSPRGGIDFWFKTVKPLGDDPDVHAAVLAYMSDDCISDNVLVPFGVTWMLEGTMVVSLDHAMWFHRPFRTDDWIYVEQRPLTASGARGTAEARFFQDGHLIATAVQEALARI